MDEKRTEEEARKLTPEEIDDMIFEEQIASGEHNEKVPEYYFSNPNYMTIDGKPVFMIFGAQTLVNKFGNTLKDEFD